MFLVDQIKKDLASVHVRQQAARFGRLFVFAVGSQLAALGTGHLGRSALVGAVVGALEVAFREWMPVVPWQKLAESLNSASGNVPQAPPAGSAGV